MRSWTLLLVALVASAALAVTPGEFTQTTEADFAAGQFKSVAVTSQGVVSLSREVKVLMPSDKAPAVVSAVAAAGKALYAASGGSATIYKIEGNKQEKFADLPGAMVATLLWDGQGLLAGACGGPKAGIYRVTKNVLGQTTVKALWTDPQIKYVWAIVPGPQGTLYAATGPTGTIYAITAAGKAEAIFQAGDLAKNILCLAKGPGGLLYAGTDENGLVIEVNPADKKSRVILDAEEKEISAVVADEHGGVYAATADIAKAAAEGQPAPSGENVGKTVHPAPTSLPASRPATQPSAASPVGAAPLSASAPPGAPAAAVPPEVLRAMAAARALTSRPAGPPAPPPQGNAVYYINSEGLVRTVVRRPVTILSMVMQGGKLILGTGNNGMIYSLSTDGDEVAQIADTDAKQVTALAAAPDGATFFGTANKGSVGRIEANPAKEGAYTSIALDAKQIAKWGTIQVLAAAPDGTKVAVATRSGNVSEPSDKTWGPWTHEQPADSFLQIASPAGRFLQYRLKFAGDGKAAPAVQQVKVVYQVGNLAPAVSGVSVQATARSAAGGEEKGPKAMRQIAIRAGDPNGDKLLLAIYFRQAGTENWIKIAEKLETPAYTWDTRTVGDGTYELKVVASDSPSNPPAAALEASRVSEPVLVDNTAPVMKDLAAKTDGGKVAVSGTATDSGSRLTALAYSVDSQEDWVALLPADGICDSNTEKFSFDLKDLKPGPHRIAVRMTDQFGNEGYGTVTVTVGK